MDIKDYLHLYIGCEVRWKMVTSEVGMLVGISKSEVEPDRTVAIISGAVFQEWYVEEVTPLLRPLSDMTDEEARECYHEEMGGNYAVVNPKHAIVHGLFYPSFHIMQLSAGTAYLLSKGFDLFGLIDAGLAIDKTKYGHPPNP